jgi:hypothetical protein
MSISVNQKDDFTPILTTQTLTFDTVLTAVRVPGVPAAIASAHPIFAGVTRISISWYDHDLADPAEQPFAIAVNPAGANVATYAVNDGEMLFGVYDGDGV